MKIKKILFVLSFLSFLLLGATNVGAASIPPEKNPICWSKKNCQSKWMSMFPLSEFNPSLNYDSPGPNGVCGADMGLCLPAGQVSTQITIGGNTKFANIGDYLKKIYLYSIYIGGTLASILLVIGGFYWLTSAGSSERIKKAKSSMTGALSGLVLLLGSYTLLYTINPDLVRLRLPQTYMIRQIVLSPKFCEELPPDEKVAFAGADKSTVTPFSTVMTNADINFSINPHWLSDLLHSQPEYADLDKLSTRLYSEFGGPDPGKNAAKVTACGWFYYPQTGNGDFCIGQLCPPVEEGGRYVPQACQVNLGPEATISPYKCIKAQFVGRLKDLEGNFGNPPGENVGLGEVCDDGTVNVGTTVGVGGSGTEKAGTLVLSAEHVQNFIIVKAAKKCKNTFGFYVHVRVNDPSSFLSTNDDNLAIGCARGSSKCDINLAKKVNINSLSSPLKPGDLEESDFTNGLEKDSKKIGDIKDYLITPEEMAAGKFVEVELNASEFQSD